MPWSQPWRWPGTGCTSTYDSDPLGYRLAATTYCSPFELSSTALYRDQRSCSAYGEKTRYYNGWLIPVRSHNFRISQESLPPQDIDDQKIKHLPKSINHQGDEKQPCEKVRLIIHVRPWNPTSSANRVHSCESLWIPPPNREEHEPCRPKSLHDLRIQETTYCLSKHSPVTKLWKKDYINSPGKRCIRTLTILSTELKTRLQRQTISAHANGPCRWTTVQEDTTKSLS